MQLRMHAKAGNKRQLTWPASDRVFFAFCCLRSQVLLMYLRSPYSPLFCLVLCFLPLPLWWLRRTKTTVLKLLRTTGCHYFRGQQKRWPRWFWSLFFFFPSADAFCGDDEGDGDEGVLCWLSSRPCLCVFLLSTVSLSALSLVTLLFFFHLFLIFFSLF